MPGPLSVGVTYLPAETGVHLWHELRPERVARDLVRIRAQGFSEVRLHLGWDSFMPTDRRVDRARLRDLEAVLEAARRVGLGVVPVLFAQSHGDCLLLPGYAVDRRRPRPGVRCVSGGSVVEGGPRDLYADPLMLEVSERWLTGLLDAFANHPAVLAWDLGHDPATTLRPRRTAHLAAWTELCAGIVRRRGDPVRLTLGAGDVLEARGVRLAAVAPHLDGLGLVIPPRRLPAVGGDASDPDAVAMTLALALRLAAGESGGDRVPPLHVVTGLAADPAGAAARLPATPLRPDGRLATAWELSPLAPPEAVAATGAVLERLHDLGAAGLCASAWTVLGPRALEAPPCDRAPSLSRHGLAEPDGTLHPHGEVWSALASREPAVLAAAPWPARLDIAGYYAGLPASARDLCSDWAGRRTEPVNP